MKHYWFVSNNEDSTNFEEEFIVGANSYKEAKEIAKENFGSVQYLGQLSEIEAEQSGLDEY